MKYTLTSLLLLFTCYSFSQIQVGAGLGFGTQIERPCLSLKANKTIMDQIEGSASINIFLPNGNGVNSLIGDFTARTNMWSFNADGHYIISISDKVDVYGLAGINISIVRIKTSYTNSILFGSSNGSATTDTNIGLNIGGGAKMVLTDKLTGFGEAKYVLSDFDQAVIIVGVLLTLGG